MKKLLFLLLMPMLTCCVINDKKGEPQTSEALLQLSKQVEETQKSLPHDAPGLCGTLIDVVFEDNILTYTIAINQGVLDGMKWQADPLDKKAKAMRTSFVQHGMGIERANFFIANNVTCRMVFVAEDAKEAEFTLEYTPTDLILILDQIKKGTASSLGYLEKEALSIEQMSFPIKIQENFFMTNKYIRGNTIYSEFLWNDVVSNTPSSKEDVARQKKDIIQNEKEVYESSEQQIIDEDVHFHLIYKNRNGKIVSEIQISPRDLLGF